MVYNPDIHRRRSIRLKGYDYSQAGLYFITLCTQNRLPLFGGIKNDAMVLNGAGQMIGKWWHELKCKYEQIKLHKQIIMPNHFHGIIQIPNKRRLDKIGQPTETGYTHRLAPTKMSKLGGYAKNGKHVDSPLHEMIQWFKTMTTNAYIRGVKDHDWQRLHKKLWQRNYYEHIIRDEKSYCQISEYIQSNPLQWQDDKYYI